MKIKSGNKIQFIRYCLEGSWHFFLAGAACTCLVSVFDLIQPKIIQYAVDEVIGGAAFSAGVLFRAASAVMAFALLGALARYGFTLFNTMGAETLTQTLRDRLYAHILRLPFSWQNTHHTGDIIQRCTSDVEEIKVFISEQLMALFRVVFLIVVSLVFMMSISPLLTLVEALFIPVTVASSFFFYTRIGGRFLRADEEEGRLSGIAQENLTGVRVVRAFGRERHERDRFEKQNAYYTDLWTRLMRVLAAFWVSGNIIANVRMLIIVLLSCVLCVHGTLTAGGFIAFLSYNTMMALPVRNLGRMLSEMSKADISGARLMEILEAPEEQDREGAGTPSLKGDIVFDHVSFQYDNGDTGVLHDVSFTVPAGKTVGILGATGSGKSTLMYLLDCMYDLGDGEGRILIGGHDIRDIQKHWLRSNIGMVLQEPYLFSGTLAENIKIAAPSADLCEIKKAARIAHLSSAVERFTSGYDTYVGERGVTLSGGQKQRTAIAQMLIRKPPIMVFDDSLSAVDAQTDAQIRESLRHSTGESTVILIAHRITTLMDADFILMMEDGRIVERGSHEELLAQGGRYRQIYEMQTQGRAL